MKQLFLSTLALVFILFLPACNDNSSDPADNSSILSISKLEIVDDNNDNGIANPGEEIAFSVYIKNDGGADAKSVYISRIKSLTDYITVDKNYTTFPGRVKTIPAHKEISMGLDATFIARIDKSIKGDSTYKFWIQAKDDLGNIINDTLSLRVIKSDVSIIIAGVDIEYDSNENGIANRGEQLKLNLRIKNVGTARANSLKVIKMNSLSDFITIKDTYSFQNVTLGDIFPGQEKVCPLKNTYSDWIKFEINELTPVNAAYKIWIQMEDAEGGVWNDTLTLQVVNTAAKIIVSKIYLKNDQNNDGKANPGEYINILYDIKNNGTERAWGVFLKNIKCKSNYLKDFTYGYAQFGEILSGVEKHTEYSSAISGTLVTTAPVGAKIPFEFTFTDANGNEWTDTAEITVE